VEPVTFSILSEAAFNRFSVSKLLEKLSKYLTAATLPTYPKAADPMELAAFQQPDQKPPCSFSFPLTLRAVSFPTFCNVPFPTSCDLTSAPSSSSSSFSTSLFISSFISSEFALEMTTSPPFAINPSSIRAGSTLNVLRDERELEPLDPPLLLIEFIDSLTRLITLSSLSNPSADWSPNCGGVIRPSLGGGVT